MRDDLKNEAVYEHERLDQRSWRAARELGVSRRRFLQLAGAAGLATALGGVRVAGVSADDPDFFVYDTNREMRWERMAGHGYEVPNRLFFVRTHRDTPLLDATTWRLPIDGSGVDKPLELSYQEILALPSASERKLIECAGNGRSFFATYNGQVAPGTPNRA